jgi:hypothetical protein
MRREAGQPSRERSGGGGSRRESCGHRFHPRSRVASAVSAVGVTLAVLGGGASSVPSDGGNRRLDPPYRTPTTTAASRVRFEDVTRPSGITARALPPKFDDKLEHINALWANFVAGAASADVDGDGFDDVFIVSSRSGEPSHLYLNNGDLTFRDATRGSGLERLSDAHNAAVGALWLDYDNDASLDVFVYGFGRNLLFHNEGGGKFRDVSAASGLSRKRQNAMAAITFDYDNDGRVDILVGGFFADDVDLFGLASTSILPADGHDASNGGSKTLYRNNGDGTFTDVSRQAGLNDFGFTTALGHGDIDGDGYQDVYVANDFGPDKLYRNNGDGTLSDISERAIGIDGKKGMNAEFGDFDNDGYIDIYVTNITEPWMHECNMLWRNRGDGTFLDVSMEANACDTGWGWGAKFFDADNDGWVDLFVANGFISAGRARYESDMAQWSQTLEKDRGLHMRDASLWPPLAGKTFAGYEHKHLFYNHGGYFQDIAEQAGVDTLLDARGVVTADFDGDGRVDLLVTHCNELPRLYHNVSEAEHWLELTVVGARSNRDGVGARVRVVTAKGMQVREVNGGNGYAAQSPRRLHFGLGAETAVDRLEVRWPNGTVQVHRAVAADQRLRIDEGGVAAPDRGARQRGFAERGLGR